MTFDAEHTRRFYNAYADAEWRRLEASASGRLKALIHDDFLARHVAAGDRVLDAGAGPGRFSAAMANRGAVVTVLDISDGQLDLARETVARAGADHNVADYIRGDICDLAMFTDGAFDAVVCFGGALSYACDRRQAAADELVRVVRPGGVILVSVMCLTGAVLNNCVRVPEMPLLSRPDEIIGGVALRPPMETGYLGRQTSGPIGLEHPAMFLFTDRTLRPLFPSCEVLETAASNVTIEERQTVGETIAADPAAWETLVEIEKKFNHDPGLVNSGSHLIMVFRKRA